MNGWASDNPQKTATPMLAALARQEIAIKRVVVLPENTRSRRRRVHVT